MVGACFLGFFGGLLGAFYIFINNMINKFRKLIKLKWIKILEVLIITVLTVTTMYLAAYIKYKSVDNADEDMYICHQVKENIPYR